MNDFEDTLPPGWASATIAQLLGPDGVFIDGDWVESKDQDPEGDVRLVQLADVGDGIFRDRSSRFLTTKKAHELGCTFLEKGDLLIARMPDPLGRCCIFPLDHKAANVTVVDVCIVRVGSAPVDNKYLMYAINSAAIRSKISDYQSGSTRKRISRGNLATIELPIAPFNEQKRIVAKIEELFSELDKGVESLTTAREQLKAYRQSVLKAAFKGELTASGAENWKVYSVGELANDIRYGTAKKCSVDPLKTPVLRIPNVASGRVDLADLKHTDFTADELAKLRLESGDILIVRSNGSASLVGLSAIVTEDAAGYAYAGYLIRLRINKDIVLPEYLNLYLHSPMVRAGIERQARSSSGVHNVNSDEIRAITLRIPPIPTQRSVVNAVNEIRSQIDALESSLVSELTRSNALRQAILQKAFSGQLVAQDAADEPAAVLLERIREAREENGTAKRRNNKNGKKEAA